MESVEEAEFEILGDNLRALPVSELTQGRWMGKILQTISSRTRPLVSGTSSHSFPSSVHGRGRRAHPRFERFHPLPQVLEHQHPIALKELKDPWDHNPVCNLGRRAARCGPEQR